MKINKEFKRDGFLNGYAPKWPCPSCDTGTLLLTEKIESIETVNSKSYHNDPDWEPYWINANFTSTVKCNSCGEVVILSGNVTVEPQHDYNEDSGYDVYDAEVFYPKYFAPQLKLFKVSEEFPDQIQTALRSVFDLFWIDRPAAATGIRKIIEILLDDQKIQENPNLHQRIAAFKIISPVSGKLLEAAKWVGNVGGHSNTIISLDTLCSQLEILEAALERVYNNEEERLSRIADEFIKSKGKV